MDFEGFVGENVPYSPQKTLKVKQISEYLLY